MNEIVMIGGEHLHEHPDNPRKNLGDLKELTKSIAANGIMQNLTVVPIKDQPGEYRVIIGHRRRAAGLAAGLKEFPCIISDMDERQQFITMLEENMQREDLTIQEQAYGFQLMFEWGESIKDIADRSGFSEQTVKHRIEIARLDKQAIKEGTALQLTIKDYIELEKIKDVKRREKVLKSCIGREYLHNAISREVEAEKLEAKLSELTPLLEAAGVKQARNNVYMRWSAEYVLVKKIPLDKKLPKELKLKDVNPEDKLFWEMSMNEIGIYKKDPESKKKAAEEENSRKAEIEQNRKALRKITDSMLSDARNLIDQIYKGEIGSARDEQETLKTIWDYWKDSRFSGLYSSSLYEISGKSQYQLGDDEKKEIREKVDKLPVSAQLMIILRSNMYPNSFATADIEGHYIKSTGENLMKMHDMLDELYGFSWSHPDAWKTIDGSHELYTKQEEES